MERMTLRSIRNRVHIARTTVMPEAMTVCPEVRRVAATAASTDWPLASCSLNRVTMKSE